MAVHAKDDEPSVPEAPEGVLASCDVGVELTVVANMELSTSEVLSEQLGGTPMSRDDVKPEIILEKNYVSSFSHSEQPVVWRDGGSTGNQSPEVAPVTPRPIWRDSELQQDEGTTTNSGVCPVLSHDTGSATLRVLLERNAKSQQIRAAARALRPKEGSALGILLRRKRGRRGPGTSDQPRAKGAIDQNDGGSIRRAVWRDSAAPTRVQKELKRNLDSTGSDCGTTYTCPARFTANPTSTAPSAWLKEAELLSFANLSLDCGKRQGSDNVRQQQQHWRHTRVSTEPSQHEQHQQLPPGNQKMHHHHNHPHHPTARGITIVKGPRRKKESRFGDLHISCSTGTIHRQRDERARSIRRRNAPAMATKSPRTATAWTSIALCPEAPPAPPATSRPLPSWFDSASKTIGVAGDPRKSRRQTEVRRGKAILDRETKRQHEPRAPAFESRQEREDDTEGRGCYHSRSHAGLALDFFRDGSYQGRNDGSDRWCLPMLLQGGRQGEACHSRS